VGLEAAFLAFDNLPEGTVVVARETFILRDGGGWGCDRLRRLLGPVVRSIRKARDRCNPYLTPLSARTIERGSFALLRRFALVGCRYRILPDNRFREIGILPPTGSTVLAQDAAGKSFRRFPPLLRLSSLTRCAHHVAPRLLHDRTFRIVVDHGWGWSFRLPVGGTLLPDLSIDFLEFRAGGYRSANGLDRRDNLPYLFQWP